MPLVHLISITVQMFSKPVHAVRAGGGHPGANHGLFKAKPSSHHVHSTLRLTPPTSPCPTLSADAEPVSVPMHFCQRENPQKLESEKGHQLERLVDTGNFEAMKNLSGWEAAHCDEHQLHAKIKVST